MQDEIEKNYSAQKPKGAANDGAQGNENADASDKISNFSMLVKDNALGDFKKQQEQDIVEVPPSAKSRRFNECDIIGELDRDEKGNVVSALVDEKSG